MTTNRLVSSLQQMASDNRQEREAEQMKKKMIEEDTISMKSYGSHTHYADFNKSKQSIDTFGKDIIEDDGNMDEKRDLSKEDLEDWIGEEDGEEGEIDEEEEEDKPHHHHEAPKEPEEEYPSDCCPGM